MTNALIRSGVIIGIALGLFWLAARFGARFVGRMEARDRTSGSRANTLWMVLRRLINVILVTTAALILFDVWGVSLTPFLAVGTVFAAALGFGAQTFVRDVIAGFFILAENQYHVGDTVTIADTTGTVADVQLRVTVLRDFEGNVHYVPNGQIEVTSNFTSQYAQPVIDMSVSYDTDLERAMAVIADEMTLMAADPDWADRIQGEPEVLGVQRLDDSAVILRARLTTVAPERWSVKREAMLRLKKRFDSEGITIPFPQLTIHRDD